MKKRVPKLKSDKAAEKFLAQDLSTLDFAQFKPTTFEFEEREKQRKDFLKSLDEANASLARGEAREITLESMKAFAEEIKQRGRARLMAERKRTR